MTKTTLHDGLEIFDIVEELPVTAPADLERLLGYDGQSRYVAVYYDRHGCQPISSDGVITTEGCTQAWNMIHLHPLVVAETFSLSLETEHVIPPVHCYLLDRETRKIFVGEAEPVFEFLNQWTCDVPIPDHNLQRLTRFAYRLWPPYHLSQREREVFLEQRKKVTMKCVILQRNMGCM